MGAEKSHFYQTIPKADGGTDNQNKFYNYYKLTIDVI